jgi:hypothetical protein
MQTDALLSYRISTLLYVTMLISTAVMFFSEPRSVIPHAICNLIIAFPLLVISKTHPFRYYLLAVCGSLFVVYMIRPILLISRSEEYVFDSIFPIASSDVIDGLYKLIPLLGFYQLGIVVTFAFLLSNRSLNIGKISSEIRRKSIIVDWANYLILLCWASLAGSAVLAIAFGIGISGGEVSGTIGFLLNLNPAFICVGIAMVLFVNHRKVLSKTQNAMLVAYLFSNAIFQVVVLTSKSGFALILFTWVVVTLLRGNDVKIRLRTIGIFSTLLVVSTFFAFPLAMAFRRTSEFTSALDSFSSNFDMLTSVGLVTRRINGFDGHLIVNDFQPAGILEAYQPSHILASGFAKLLPGVTSPYMSTGQAVGVYYIQFDFGHRFGGGIGLLGAYQLMFQRYTWIIIIAAAVQTLIFSGIARIKDFDHKSIIMFAFFYTLIVSMISGNIGATIPELVVNLAQWMLIYFTMKLCQTSTHE